jgi:sugar phosphate permease
MAVSGIDALAAPPRQRLPAFLNRLGIHYAWVVFAAAFLVLLSSAGFRSTPAVLLVPLHEDLGWSRASIAFAVALGLVFFGLVGPLVAALMSRHGVRAVVLGSLLLVAVGSAGSVRVTAVWQLVLLWGVVVGIGTGGMATVLAATVASRWFVEKRGIVTGALTAAMAAGQVAFLPFLAVLADQWGWRAVSLAVAAVAVAVMPIVVLLMRDRPEDVGLRPYGAPDDFVPPLVGENPIAAAMKALTAVLGSKAFWLLAGSFWVCGASTNGLIGTHFIAASVDHGMPETSGATLLAVIGGFNVIGAIASGWLTDRYDPRYLLMAYYGFRGLSLLFLHDALSQGDVALWVFVVFYGLDWIATVPPTVALSNELFGSVSGPIVFGWVFAAHQLGAAFAAFGAGAVRTTTGSYHLAFIVSGMLCLAAAGGVLGIRRQRVEGLDPTREVIDA